MHSNPGFGVTSYCYGDIATSFCISFKLYLDTNSFTLIDGLYGKPKLFAPLIDQSVL
jgi:hypothetical protein